MRWTVLASSCLASLAAAPSPASTTAPSSRPVPPGELAALADRFDAALPVFRVGTWALDQTYSVARSSAEVPAVLHRHKVIEADSSRFRVGERSEGTGTSGERFRYTVNYDGWSLFDGQHLFSGEYRPGDAAAPWQVSLRLSRLEASLDFLRTPVPPLAGQMARSRIGPALRAPDAATAVTWLERTADRDLQCYAWHARDGGRVVRVDTARGGLVVRVTLDQREGDLAYGRELLGPDNWGTDDLSYDLAPAPDGRWQYVGYEEVARRPVFLLHGLTEVDTRVDRGTLSAVSLSPPSPDRFVPDLAEGANISSDDPAHVYLWRNGAVVQAPAPPAPPAPRPAAAQVRQPSDWVDATAWTYAVFAGLAGSAIALILVRLWRARRSPNV